MADRRQRDLEAASTARALSAIKNFARFLARRGFGANAALDAIRNPKLPRAVPKPLNVVEAEDALEAVAGLHETDWIGRRDLAVLTLLYGCGLRISEALSLARRDAPKPGGSLRIRGKGNKTRMVPVLPVVAEAIEDYIKALPIACEPEGPLFLGARGQAPFAAAGPARDAEAAPAARPAGNRHAARAAPFLRDAPAGRRRRSPRDPGAARPCLALDHPALHRG